MKNAFAEKIGEKMAILKLQQIMYFFSKQISPHLFQENVNVFR
jgi:hypothetical protein